MPTDNFFEKYKDPRWQKKRLKIMERDDFSCKNCGNSDRELTVHHLHYEKGLSPWEYGDESLVTYCKICHDEWHRLKTMLNKNIGYLTAELRWLAKCAEKGPHMAIRDRFDGDTSITLSLLSRLAAEAMKNNGNHHSQVVDCCLILKEFVESGGCHGDKS
jgi:hypothetical protein